MTLVSAMTTAALTVGCSSGPPRFAAQASAPTSLCEAGRPYLSQLRGSLGLLYDENQPTEPHIDALSDMLIDVYDQLASSPWDELAQQAREIVARADRLPVGNSATSHSEVISWTLAAAVIHDRIQEDCQRPARDEAQERRSEFLDATDS